MSKSSEINIKIDTNENNVPTGIHWSAEDGGVDKAEAKALILSLWDKKEQNAMRIDLWNDQMSVEEMKQFFHQTLMTMADTFERATGEKNMSDDLRDYCFHFADKMSIIAPDK